MNAPVSLIAELKADQDPRAQCKFCVWLDGRPAAEQAEWAIAMQDRSFTNTSIYRAARLRGYGGSGGAPEAHRKRHPEGRA